MQQMTSSSNAPRRDPAPSRLAYRMQRLLLTPFFRRLLWVGLPALVLSLVVGIYLSDQARRDGITLWVNDLKATVRERPEFMVKLMAIDGASPGVSDDIREVVPIDFPVSSFDLDLPRMLRDVMALDAVAKADLRVRPGGVLQISVVERIPVAIWRNDDTLDLLDDKGHRVAPLAARAERPDLPLIAGRGAERAVGEGIEIVSAAAPLAERLRGLVRVGERRWDVILEGGQTIKLPEDEPVRALEQVLALDEAQDLLARDVSDVDMRNPRRPTVRLGEVAAETLREIRVMELGAD
ncbi:cell division protein FtsQ/DivIB [Oceaniglobus trochenteri]|uniref:cell division protein FtsQ/DivIB n=1 Tax=Oceaniglobus trochenteri TaxID=2763260 RepID=UPI001D0002A0|nr:cell division protein FtsQ/DivIB [Oceaniglobus trochenteri]